MREILDRLREAETALDKQLMELFYMKHTEDLRMVIQRVWKAKQNIWTAQMYMLQAAAGPKPTDPT